MWARWGRALHFISNHKSLFQDQPINILFSATKYEMCFDKSRSSLETGQLVEDRLLPRPAEAGSKQTCIVRIPEKNEIYHYSIVAIDQVHIQNV